jgi:hypothetical protein
MRQGSGNILRERSILDANYCKKVGFASLTFTILLRSPIKIRSSKYGTIHRSRSLVMSTVNANSMKDTERLQAVMEWDKEKVQHRHVEDNSGQPPPDSLAVDFKHDLHRGLKSRQIAMVLTSPYACYDKLTDKDCNRRCDWNRPHHRHGWYGSPVHRISSDVDKLL